MTMKRSFCANIKGETNLQGIDILVESEATGITSIENLTNCL